MENSLVVLLLLQFPALNVVAVGNQILENVLLACENASQLPFLDQVVNLDNLEYKKMVGYGK